VKTVLSCHSVRTSLPEIALSAWISASSVAGSPRGAFTLTRNIAAPAVFFFGALRLLLVKCLRLALLLTSLFRLRLPIFLQLSAGLGCRTNTAWVLSKGCRAMQRQRPLVRRSGIAEYWVSEQEDIGEHGCPLRFCELIIYSETNSFRGIV